MFLRAGLLSLALLLASRLLGLARESAQAAAFGASAAGDLAALMLSLPDWLAGVLASGALAYVLLPAWSRLTPAGLAASQRRLAALLLASGLALALGLALARQPVLQALAGGLPPALQGAAQQGLLWSAAALPAALLAALWATRLQHEGDFLGLYAANLVVNLGLVGALLLAASRPAGALEGAVPWLGPGLAAAMLARLGWLAWRLRRLPAAASACAPSGLPAWPLWLAAAAAAGLPLALPFAARSLASGAGAGALATFNYGWKLVELPLMLAVQLVATLALGPIARAEAARQRGAPADPGPVLRRGLALAWALACASAAGLLVAAPALARLLFGWGRMEPAALLLVADWARLGAWTLLPQALIALLVALLAAQQRLLPVAGAYGAALLVLLAGGERDGARLMLWLLALYAAVAGVLLLALRAELRARLPWRGLLAGLAMLGLVALASRCCVLAQASTGPQLAAGAVAAALVLAACWLSSPDVRAALRR